MRAGLMKHPRVVAMCRALQHDDGFKAWAIADLGGPDEQTSMSNEALRAVTVGLLLVVWSEARAHGRFDGVDLVLEHNTIDDLDQICGAPGIGAAMESVGWARTDDAKGLVLPGFREHNIPMDNAERQSRFRERQRNEVSREVTARTPSEQSRAEKETEKNLSDRGERKRAGSDCLTDCPDRVSDMLDRLGVREPARSQLAACAAVTPTELRERWRRLNADLQIKNPLAAFVHETRAAHALDAPPRRNGNLSPSTVLANRRLLKLRETRTP